MNIAALETEAARWIGTPWCPHGDRAGIDGGADCSRVPVECLRAAGALPADFSVPAGTHTDSGENGTMEAWMDSRPEFTRAATRGEGMIDYRTILPGDVIGMRLRRCGYVNHVGVALSGFKFAHTLMDIRTRVDDLADPSWNRRVYVVWRVKA